MRLIVVILSLSSISAQPLVSIPTSAWALAWTAPTEGGAPTSYEVRWHDEGAYASVGIPDGLRVMLPTLTAGTYMAQVRGCNPSGCSDPASLEFRVGATVQAAPTGRASGLRLIGPTALTSVAKSDKMRVSSAVSNRVFFNGWDGQSEPGCSWTNLVDTPYDLTHPVVEAASHWSDFSPPSACTDTPPHATIDTAVKWEGARSLQTTGVVRITKNVVLGPEFTLVAAVRFSEQYAWTPSQRAFVLMGANGSEALTVAVNGSSLWSIVSANGVAYADTSVPLRKGVWYRLRLHVKTGSHGSFEAFLTGESGQEQSLTLRATDVNVPMVTAIRLDTTGSAAAPRWFDSVALFSGLVS